VRRLGFVRLGSATQRLRDVVALQIGVEREHLVDGRPLGDQLGEPGDGDAQSADAGSTAELVGTYCDAREGHASRLSSRAIGGASRKPPAVRCHRGGANGCGGAHETDGA
jgi:hypothetical protein